MRTQKKHPCYRFINHLICLFKLCVTCCHDNMWPCVQRCRCNYLSFLRCSFACSSAAGAPASPNPAQKSARGQVMALVTLCFNFTRAPRSPLSGGEGAGQKEIFTNASPSPVNSPCVFSPYAKRVNPKLSFY